MFEITPAEWRELRAAADSDNKELFEGLVTELARMAIAEQKIRERHAAEDRAFKQGGSPFFCLDR